jgi:hypothetical protein
MVPLAIHTPVWPFCSQATELIAQKRGSAYRISSRGLIAALAKGYGGLYDQTRKQIGLFRERGVSVVDMYAVEEERPQGNPWRINGAKIYRSADLLEIAAEQVRTSFDILVETRLFPSTSAQSEPSDIVFGCSDVRYFSIVADFVKERFQDRVHQYFWAGSATSSLVPIDTVELVNQLRAARAMNVHVMFHDDCAGHGGRHKLGNIDQQLTYYRNMIATGSPLRSAVNRELPDLKFHFYFLEEGTGVTELGTWQPRFGA